MIITKAQIGYGYGLSYCTTQNGTYLLLAEILDIKPGKIEVAKVPIQRNDSPDLYGEKISGWKDVSDYEVKLVYDGTAGGTKYATIAGLVATPLFWRFTRPLAAGQTFNATTPFYGFISELSDEVPLKEAMSCSIKITVSGGQSFNPGS